MRAMNAETGKPYPRRRPVNFEAVREILLYRREAKRLTNAGYKRVKAFAALEWESPMITHTISDVVVGHLGKSLWVKIVPNRRAA